MTEQSERLTDNYPSRAAMEAAVEIEINLAIGSVQTIVLGRIIQKAIDAALKSSGGE